MNVLTLTLCITKNPNPNFDWELDTSRKEAENRHFGMPPRELNFITGNRNKLAEVRAILGEIVPLKSRSLDLAEIQGTIEEISLDKCRRAAEAVRA